MLLQELFRPASTDSREASSQLFDLLFAVIECSSNESSAYKAAGNIADNVHSG